MRFKKIGGGFHRMRLNGKKVKVGRGEIIDCEKHELGGAIRAFEQLDADPPPEPLPERVRLYAVPREGGDLTGYNVMNPVTNAPLNDAPLTKEEAEDIVVASVTLSVTEIRQAMEELPDALGDPGDGAKTKAERERNARVIVERGE